MSNDKAMAIVPRTVDEAKTLATTLSKSSLLPQALRGHEADVFFSIMAGQELGMPPMASIRGIHVISGKPVLSADAMVGVVLGSGLCEYFICVEETYESATYETQRKGSPQPQRCTWSMQDAKNANLGGDNWKKHPRAMLKARAKAMLARDAYPDVLAGCYDEDEAREFAPSERSPVRAVDAEIVSETIAPRTSDLDIIENAATVADLEALAPQLAKLPDSLKAEAKSRYRAQKHKLMQQSGAAA